MKKLILASLALLLVLAAVPAMAGEQTSQGPAMFQALSKLSGPGQTALNVMTDDQLAAVEGQSHRNRIRNVLTNVAVVTQVNACIACVDVLQANGVNLINTVD